MRVLVTAGAGFLGRQVVAALASEGHEVICADARTESGLRLRSLDLTERDLDRVESVFHLEWSGSFKQAVADPIGTRDRNLRTLEHVLRLCRTTGTRLIFTSTSLVYGGTLDHPSREDEDVNPKSHYGDQKLAAERMIGNDGCSVRVFNLYGMGSTDPTQIIPRLVSAALGDGKVSLNGDGLQTRDFVHVKDAAHALASLVTKEANGMVLNLSSGEPTTILGLVQDIFALVNRTPEITWNPAVAGESRMICGNPEALRSLTGWYPQISLNQGLQELLGVPEAEERSVDLS